MANLALKNIVKDFGSNRVVQGIDLDIDHGEFVVLLGPSGCAKTTTLRMIAGLEDISEGELFIDGELVNEKSPKQRRIAMVFQNYALYPHMTVEQNIAFGLKVSKTPKAEIAERVDKACNILDLSALRKRRPGELSGGQRQRVAMGRAMVREPSVFLFDEPLSNLDAKLRNQMRIEIKSLHRRLGNTMIYVTHDQLEAMTLADRVVILRDGRIEQVGKPYDVYHQPANRFVAGFIGTPSMNFMDVQVFDDNGTMKLRKNGVQIDCPKRFLNKLQPGENYCLGIRPNQISMVSADTPNAIPCEITLTELLGAEILLRLTTAGGDVISVLVDSRDNLEEGAQIHICLDEKSLHLFDLHTGASMECL